MIQKSMQNPTSKATLKYFWQHSKKYAHLLYTVLFCITVGVVINDIIVPFYYKDLIDTMSASSGDKAAVFPELLRILLIVVGFFLFSEVFWRTSGYVNATFQTKIIRDITDDCFEKLHQHSFSFFANHFAGALVTKVKRMFNHFERIADILTWEIFPNVLRVGFSIAVLFFIAPIFALILSIWLLIYMAVNWVFSLWKMKHDRYVANLDSRLTGELADAITNAVPIKLFARIKYECRKLFGTTDEKYRAQQKQWNLSQHMNIFAGISMMSVEFGMMFFAIKLWMADQITVGTIVLIQSYLASILKNLWNFGNTIQDFYHSLAETEEMTEILNLPIEIRDQKNSEKCRITEGKIEFQNVDFSYEGGKTSVFKNLNLAIHPGEKIGVVGESGAGKTTVTKLLLRFGDIDAGKILIDGQNIAKITQDDLRRNIAFVPQEPILFHRTLFDNISYGNLEATEEEVLLAAKNSHAHEFIQNCPEQYETFVGERGIKLSGGEKQRVAIARAMLKNAPILILDEATSSLDSKAEKLIQEALHTLMQNRTTLVIAHRLSTLREMDRIIVFDDGKIVEQGAHDELLKNKGKYSELWSHQIGGFLVE